MSDHIQATIDELAKEVSEMEAKVIKTKQLVNLLCERAGVEPAYDDAQLAPSSRRDTLAADEFFNKPLNTAVKTYLARRKVAGRGPATADEIYDGLIAGGYAKFPNSKEEALTGLRISLGKSSHTFVKLPNNSYGLGEWYGGLKRKPATNGKSEPEKAEEEGTEATTAQAAGDIFGMAQEGDEAAETA